MCLWTEDGDGNWDTACDQKHIFFDGGPVRNGYQFCPYCGALVVETTHLPVGGMPTDWHVGKTKDEVTRQVLSEALTLLRECAMYHVAPDSDSDDDLLARIWALLNIPAGGGKEAPDIAGTRTTGSP